MAKKKSAGLLAGIRILDLTRVLAGPHCTMVLGDLGADVIKVEEPGRGDDTRHWGPPFTKSGMSAYFISANRNKRSMTLNLKSKAGISVLKDLVKKADVLVENFKPGTLERLGVSEKALKKLNPDLVYCTITGYGYSGPESENPGYDFIAQARGGLMSITGAADGEPIRVGVAIVDLLSGIYACNAIVAALFARERQKKWQRIDISLLDSMVGSMSYVASNYLVSGNLPKRFGNAHPNIVPYQGFAASDGYFAFAAGNDLQWARFCKAIGREDWARDERFALNPSRVKNRQELIRMLDELFAAKSTEEWLKICEEAGVPAAAVKSMDQVLADPQVQAREMVQTIKIAEEEIRILASPIKIPTAPAKLRFPPPSLGEHTDEILSSLLKYKKTQISKLRNAKVI